MKLIMLGAPGAGKGTQAAIFSERLGIPTISTGNILRAAVKNGTPVGLQAKSYMDAGKLVPDEVIIGIIAERLGEEDCRKGYILDGVPRTIAQAEALEASGIRFDCVLDIEVADEEIQRRMSGRRACTACGATYHVEAAPPQDGGRVRRLRRQAGPAGRRQAGDRAGPSEGVPRPDRTAQGVLRPAGRPQVGGEPAHH